MFALTLLRRLHSNLTRTLFHSSPPPAKLLTPGYERIPAATVLYFRNLELSPPHFTPSIVRPRDSRAQHALILPQRMSETKASVSALHPRLKSCPDTRRSLSAACLVLYCGRTG